MAPGVCSTGVREPWVMGRWRLDDHHLGFMAASTRGNVRIPLGSVRRVDRTRRKFLVVAKPVLVVTYLTRAASTRRRVWLLTGDLDDWESRLTAKVPGIARQRPTDPMRTAVALTRVLETVSGSTAQVLDVLASGGPVVSATLAVLLDLDVSDAVALPEKVAEHFAPVDRVLGAPTVRYERSRFELSTGAVHSMSWWLDSTVAGIWQSLREPCDVQCDGETVIAITSLPTRSSKAPVTVLVDDDGRGMLLSGALGYTRYIELPVAVYAQVAVSVQPNGTLVLVGQCRQGHQAVQSIEENS